MTVTLAQLHQRLDDMLLHMPEGQTMVVEVGGEKLSVVRAPSEAPLQGVSLGVRLIPDYVMSEGFLDPMSEDELRLWEGTAV